MLEQGQSINFLVVYGQEKICFYCVLGECRSRELPRRGLSVITNGLVIEDIKDNKTKTDKNQRGYEPTREWRPLTFFPKRKMLYCCV